MSKMRLDGLNASIVVIIPDGCPRSLPPEPSGVWEWEEFICKCIHYASDSMKRSAYKELGFLLKCIAINDGRLQDILNIDNDQTMVTCIFPNADNLQGFEKIFRTRYRLS